MQTPKNLFASIILALVATLALAGVSLGQARLEGEVHSLVNQGGPGFNRVGAGLGAGYSYRGYYFGLETAGGDGFPARSAAFGRYERLTLGENRFSPGFGYTRFGTQASVFGSLGYQYERFESEVRAGANKLVDVRAGYQVFQGETFAIIPGFRFRREDVGGVKFNLYSFGLAFRLDQR